MTKKSGEQPKIGVAPKADFLPPHVKLEHDARNHRRRLFIATVAVSFVSVTAFLGCQSILYASQSHLDDARAATEQILSEQGPYSDIVSLVEESKKLGAAYAVSSANEIDFGDMMQLAIKALPAGARVDSLHMTGPASAESVAALDPATRAPQLAVANVSIWSPTFADVEYFLLDARQWPGYLNSSVASIQPATGGFKAELLIGFGSGALSPVDGRDIAALGALTK